MKTTNATILILLCTACFADVGPVEGDSSDDTSGGTTTATDGSTAASTSVGTGSGTSASTTSDTDSGSTGASGTGPPTGTTTGVVTGTGDSTGSGGSGGSSGSSGATGSTGEPGAGLYEACMTDDECQSGVCAQPYGGTNPPVTGFCSVSCAGFGDPCPANPFGGYASLCDKWPSGGPYQCGIRCINNFDCPTGWDCKTYLDEFVHPICFEEV